MHPEIDEAIFSADNAGCYHCEDTVRQLWSQRKSVPGMTLLGLHFGEPGKGKSICDQYFAILKALVARFICAGNCVDTPKKFAEAMCYGEGVANTVIMLGDIIDPMEGEKEKSAKIENISKYHEFLFSDEGIQMRYLPGFGEGELKKMNRELEDNANVPKFEYEIMNITNLDENNLNCMNTSKPLPYREECKKVHDVTGGFGDVVSNENAVIPSANDDIDTGEKKLVYKCKNPLGCTKTFLRYRDYLQHCRHDGELCEVPVVKQSSGDQIVKLWISKNGISQEYQGKSYKETRNMIFHKDLLPSIDPIFLNSGIKESLRLATPCLKKGKILTSPKSKRTF